MRFSRRFDFIQFFTDMMRALSSTGFVAPHMFEIFAEQDFVGSLSLARSLARVISPADAYQFEHVRAGERAGGIDSGVHHMCGRAGGR